MMCAKNLNASAYLLSEWIICQPIRISMWNENVAVTNVEQYSFVTHNSYMKVNLSRPHFVKAPETSASRHPCAALLYNLPDGVFHSVSNLTLHFCYRIWTSYRTIASTRWKSFSEHWLVLTASAILGDMSPHRFNFSSAWKMTTLRHSVALTSLLSLL